MTKVEALQTAVELLKKKQLEELFGHLCEWNYHHPGDRDVFYLSVQQIYGQEDNELSSLYQDSRQDQNDDDHFPYYSETLVGVFDIYENNFGFFQLTVCLFDIKVLRWLFENKLPTKTLSAEKRLKIWTCFLKITLETLPLWTYSPLYGKHGEALKEMVELLSQHIPPDTINYFELQIKARINSLTFDGNIIPLPIYNNATSHCPFALDQKKMRLFADRYMHSRTSSSARSAVSQIRIDALSGILDFSKNLLEIKSFVASNDQQLKYSATLLPSAGMAAAATSHLPTYASLMTAYLAVKLPNPNGVVVDLQTFSAFQKKAIEPLELFNNVMESIFVQIRGISYHIHSLDAKTELFNLRKIYFEHQQHFFNYWFLALDFYFKLCIDFNSYFSWYGRVVSEDQKNKDLTDISRNSKMLETISNARLKQYDEFQQEISKYCCQLSYSIESFIAMLTAQRNCLRILCLEQEVPLDKTTEHDFFEELHKFFKQTLVLNTFISALLNESKVLLMRNLSELRDLTQPMSIVGATTPTGEPAAANSPCASPTASFVASFAYLAASLADGYTKNSNLPSGGYTGDEVSRDNAPKPQ